MYQLFVLRYSASNTRGVTMASVGLFGNLALLVLSTAIGIALTWVSLEAALMGAGVFMMPLGRTAGVSTLAVRRPVAGQDIAPGGRGAERT